MIKTFWTSAAVSAMALAAAACAQTGADATANARSNTAPAQQSAAVNAPITEADLQAYTAARNEIASITAGFAELTDEERGQATAQIVAIQERHNLTPARYDAIARALESDPQLAQRQEAVQGFSDAQVASFAAASVEIDPVARTLADASETEQAEGAEQIRLILDRHGLDGSTYNAIATAAQTDPDLQQRINDARVTAEAASSD
ncbi:MAG: DUF4168 domain-containing protein [Terricaulis sp.]|nr:DUF4168 domain-containing protein [Terricaulis sp.]